MPKATVSAVHSPATMRGQGSVQSDGKPQPNLVSGVRKPVIHDWMPFAMSALHSAPTRGDRHLLFTFLVLSTFHISNSLYFTLLSSFQSSISSPSPQSPPEVHSVIINAVVPTFTRHRHHVVLPPSPWPSPHSPAADAFPQMRALAELAARARWWGERSSWDHHQSTPFSKDRILL